MTTDPIQITPTKKLIVLDGKSQIELQNDSLNGYGYKIRTTCPNSYKVEPNIGILKPLDSVKISVRIKDIAPSSNDKFNILIYEFDHKKSFDELKRHIHTAAGPKISRILPVEHEKMETKIDQNENESFYLIILTLILLYLMPRLVKNFLFL